MARIPTHERATLLDAAFLKLKGTPMNSQNPQPNDNQSYEQPQSSPSRFAGIKYADPAERIRVLKELAYKMALRIIQADKARKER
ncbi:MAG TPA: hypothetical protein VHV10_14910 [Ktedonobacteraceae bacterium]|nr:hypothetical protein [Ktedonobacteraceae bacterium]